MADGVWKGVQSNQLLLNKYFDPSTPSMRKGSEVEEKKEKKRKKRKKGEKRIKR